MRRRWTRSSSPAYWNHESAVVGNKDCAHKRVEAVKWRRGSGQQDIRDEDGHGDEGAGQQLVRVGTNMIKA
jgi:hypothetical protein